MTLRIASPTEQTKTRQFAQASAVTAAMVPVVISSKVFIPLNLSDADADNAYVIDALAKDAPKATGEAWTMGQKLYWDNTAKKFTTTATSNTLCGYAAAPAASADTTGSVDFNSNAA